MSECQRVETPSGDRNFIQQYYPECEIRHYICQWPAVHLATVECQGTYFKDGMDSCVLAMGYHIGQYGHFGLDKANFTMLKYSRCYGPDAPLRYNSDAIFYEEGYEIGAVSRWGVFHDIPDTHTMWVSADADRPEHIHRWWRKVLREMPRLNPDGLRAIPRLPRVRIHLARKVRDTVEVHFDAAQDTVIDYRMIHQANFQGGEGSSFYTVYTLPLSRGVSRWSRLWERRWKWLTLIYYLEGGEKQIIYIDPRHYEAQ